MDTQIVQMNAHPVVVSRQADTDEQLVSLWLHGRSGPTIKAYSADVDRFRKAVAKPLHAVTLAELQGFADALGSLAPASQARTLAAVKSLFAFAQRLGYLTFDVARVVKLPKIKSTLAERIMTEAQVLKMLAVEENPRNAIMLKVLYAAGLRVSELVGLKWRDAQDRSEGDGQLTIFGKGGKTRVVRLPASVWSELVELRGEADAPMFRSREGGHLDQSQVSRIVHAAARRARIKASVSPHWMRHAHASHAIERGAPIHLVQATLGHASVATTGRYLHARPSESSSKYLPL